MNIRQRFIAALCLLFGVGTPYAAAQVDVTAIYLENAGFDSHYDYDASATGNVAQEMLDVANWTKDYTVAYTIVGTYQVGTQKTFNGAKVPATNADGTAEGGVLALSTGWDESIKLYQEVTLPKGDYALVTAYYNGGSATAATSLVGWVPNSGTGVVSTVTTFPKGEWITDTLSFSLIIRKAGKIQIGMKGAGGGSENSAKLSLDYVRLFSYNWDGSLLTNAIENAEKLYADTTANGRDDLKAALDAAVAVQSNADATADEQVAVTAALNKAINVFKALKTSYKNLQKSIDSAVKTLGDDTGYGSAELQALIDAAKQLVADTEATSQQLDTAKVELDKAVALYKTVVRAFATLQETIDEANVLLGDGTANGADEFKAAIDKVVQATTVPGMTADDIKALTAELEEAAFMFQVLNGSGDAPTVETHPFVGRGSTVALGRSTVSGTILEEGFCWATHSDPTIFDNRSSKYYTKSGRIYAMEGLEPATKYYVRAYAVSKEYAVGYGDVVKVITLPKGNVKWTYDYGADEAANTRIATAVEDAVNYLNTYTSISGLTTQVHYGSGTPTADCSYGGWMRVGPNSSYQRTGTILHELGHAIGVGTHGVWYNGDSPLRAGSGTGNWLGDRATDVVRFLENSKTSVMTGDGTHMWPYGVNGAHEDDGTAILYICNTLIYQALGEDGLPPTGGFSTPAYTFDQEDTIKYYIKNEHKNYGLYDSYLVENEKGNLVWQEMDAATAVADDHAAWYITFNPANCYYQLRNAATGHYVSYSKTGVNGIRTAEKSAPSTNENFHLMRSRIDVTLGENTQSGFRGYWIIHPEHKQNPTTLIASSNGATSTAAFNLGNTVAIQRWLLLTAEETRRFETASSIEQVEVATGKPAEIYSITGVRLREGTTLQDLPTGIYIIGGRKVMVK